MTYRYTAPSAHCIRTQASEKWPNRSIASDGELGDASHSARVSDHNPDERGVVHAADLTQDAANGCDNNRNCTQHLNDPRLKYRIWNRRIYNPSIAPYWRQYTGPNPHLVEMHTSVNSGPTENNTSPWFDDNEGDFTVAEADRVIHTIGEYEQDTRALLIDVMEKQEHAARLAGRRWKNAIIDAIEALGANDTPKLHNALKEAASVEEVSPAGVAAKYARDLEVLNAAQDGGHDHP